MKKREESLAVSVFLSNFAASLVLALQAALRVEQVKGEIGRSFI
jgi:hypothetical protein